MPVPSVEQFRLRFLGAVRTVTGSKYLLANNSKKILIDCGLFQGLKELRLKNWDRFPIDPKSIDAIVLTHAHLDHSGYIPRLVKEGFKGRVFCTPATFALCRILLVDAGYLQEEEAEWLNRKKFSKHSPALPLFTKKEAEISLEQFVQINFDEPFQVLPDVRATFQYAGHILGAATAKLAAQSASDLFGYNQSNPLRIENSLQAGEIDRKIAAAWAGHQNYHEIASTENFLAKAQAAMKLISKYIPDCCRGSINEV